MKKTILLAFASAAVLCACEKNIAESPLSDEPSTPETTVPEDPSQDILPVTGYDISGGRTITVKALETKTGVSPKEGGGFSFTWNKDDQIQLIEFIYENRGSQESNADWYGSFTSDALDADKATADFSVNLSTTLANPEGGKYRYVGLFPLQYDTEWDESGTPVVYTYFPYSQSPTATSYDPSADLLVSRPNVMDTRAEGELALSFARIGAVVKITLKGLPAGEKLETGYILFGDSYKVNGQVNYNVEDGSVEFVEANYTTFVDSYPVVDSNWNPIWQVESNSAVSFAPEDLFVDSNGNADIWLRLPGGKVTDSFFIRVWTREDEYSEWHSYGKSVDLATANKSLTFTNGGMTVFTVNTAVMTDPYIKLSYSYTDENGDEQTAVSESGDILVGQYGAYLSPNGETVVLDVETNADPSEIVIDNSCSWVHLSFDPATMKLTLTCDICTDYTNYAVSSREAYGIYVGLSSFQGATVNVRVNQNKRYFNSSGTRKSILTWHGGSASGDIKCNVIPEIDCPPVSESGVEVDVVKVDNGTYTVTFTLAPNETASLNVVTAYIRDKANPDSKYVKVNLLRYPKVADGDYYFTYTNTHAGYTPYPRYAVGASIQSDTPSIHMCELALDGSGQPDFDNTENLAPLTFTRIEDTPYYRITCTIGSDTYYLCSSESYRTFYSNNSSNNTLDVILNKNVPKVKEGVDYSRWDVVLLGSTVVISNHASDPSDGNYTFAMSLNPAYYLRYAGNLKITDNQGSYGTSYFCDTYTYQISTTDPPKLYELSSGNYLPLSY